MFLHPLMLAGLGGAVVPLVLHLLGRARYKDVEWGAMMFLAGADARQRQSARVTQALLLILRMAMVAVIAVALARPVLQTRWEGTSGGGPLTAVIVLDCSQSMSFDENGRTRFDLAQRAAKQVLAGLRAGDVVALITTGAAEGVDATDVQPTTDQRTIAARIERLKPGYGAGSMSAALSQAADLLQHYEGQDRDIYVICDRQGTNWRDIDESFADQWLARLKAPTTSRGATRNPPARLFIVPVGNTDSDNVAVESLTLLNAPAIRGQPAEVEVRLRNYGNTPHAQLPLALSVGDRKLLETKVNLAASEVTTLRFARDAADHPFHFGQAGSQILAAAITSSGYRADDRIQTAIEVIEPIAVLVVSGDERAGAFRSESDFLRWSLAPHQAAGKDAALDPCVVEIMAAEKWPESPILSRYQVVILANLERLSATQVRAVEQYVYNGGRLIIAPGSLSRVEDYNSLLYRDGAGIAPGELEDATPASGEMATSLLGYDTSHPIFQFLKGKPDPIPSATIGRYFPATVRQSYARALAWYTSGDPFLIEGQSERGKVLMLTTSLDADWTTLPLTNFYLPFVQNAVRYLAAGDSSSRTLLVGDPIQLAFADAPPDRKVTVTLPDGATRPLVVSRFNGQSQVGFLDTRLPGEYHIRVDDSGKPARNIFFVLRAPAEESDLSQLSSERWSWLQQHMGFRRMETRDAPLREAVAAGREGRELWGVLLAASMLLAVLEMLVSRAGSIERASGRSAGA